MHVAVEGKCSTLVGCATTRATHAPHTHALCASPQTIPEVSFVPAGQYYNITTGCSSGAGHLT